MFRFEIQKFDEGTSSRSGVLIHSTDRKEDVLTPTRAITNVDIGRVNELREKVDIFRGGIEDVPNGIQEVTYPYFGQRLETLRKPEPTDKQEKLLERYVYEVNKATLFNPLFSFSKGVRLTRKEIETLTVLQVYAKYSPITIPEPYPSCSSKEFTNNIESALDIKDKYSDKNIPAIAQVSLATRERIGFETKMNIANKFGLIGTILNYAPIAKYFGVYYSLSQISRSDEFKKFFIHLSGVPKSFRNASLMNLLVGLGIDSFAMRGIAFSSKSKETVIKERKLKLP